MEEEEDKKGEEEEEEGLKEERIPYSGYFSRGKFFMDMENFAGSWKKNFGLRVRMH